MFQLDKSDFLLINIMSVRILGFYIKPCQGSVVTPTRPSPWDQNLMQNNMARVALSINVCH